VSTVAHNLITQAKRFAKQSMRAKKLPRLSLAHFSQERFHVIQILFQRSSPGRRQTVFSFGRAALESF
jgi:hypothetical protein